METPVERRRICFYGRVQGVGFRYHLMQDARNQGLTGWVRNLADGSVEAEIQGPSAAIDYVILNLGKGRWIRVAWAAEISESYVTSISIASKDRSGLVMDIATVLNTLNAKVRTLASRDIGGGRALTNIALEVKNAGELRYIMNRLNAVPGVSEVTRSGEK